METTAEFENKLDEISSKIDKENKKIDRLYDEIMHHFSEIIYEIPNEGDPKSQFEVNYKFAIELIRRINEALQKEENLENKAEMKALLNTLKHEETYHLDVQKKLDIIYNHHLLSSKLLRKHEKEDIMQKGSELKYFFTFVFASLLGVCASYIIKYNF